MRKTVITALLGLICGLLLCFTSKTALFASATNDISVRVTPITSSAQASTYSYNAVTILPGDYLVTLLVENNTEELDAISSYIDFNDTYYSPIMDPGLGEIYTWSGPNTYNFSIALFTWLTNSNRVTIACANSYPPLLGDGEVINFFLRPNGSVPSSTNILTDFSIVEILGEDGDDDDITDEFNYSTTTYYLCYEYLVGDVDGSGSITLADPACLNDLVTGYTSVTENTPNVRYILYNEGFYGLFRDDGTFIFAVADVNLDGVIDSDDFDEVAYYYSLMLMHATSSYTGLVNTVQVFYVPTTY